MANFSKSRVLYKVSEKGTFSLGDIQLPELSYNTVQDSSVQDKSKEVSAPKLSSIRSSVSLELRLLTDTRDTGPQLTSHVHSRA